MFPSRKFPENKSGTAHSRFQVLERMEAVFLQAKNLLKNIFVSLDLFGSRCYINPGNTFNQN
jgi:hypothetical protein